jgi:L-lysine exporter family protein LysE/ArgO
LLTPFATGFGIGAGLIIAIGAQNAFVLRQGLARQHVFAVAAICAICDALLIVAGVAGLGAIIQANPSWMTIIAGGGVAFLVWYGIKALRRALSPVAMQVEGEATDLRQAIVTCLTFTLLNPHVYLDTVVLVGALSAPFPGTAKVAYGAGAATASFVWFFGLAYGARLLAPLFRKPAAWRALDLVIAAIMFLIAAKLGVFLWTQGA